MGLFPVNFEINILHFLVLPILYIYGQTTTIIYLLILLNFGFFQQYIISNPVRSCFPLSASQEFPINCLDFARVSLYDDPCLSVICQYQFKIYSHVI
jgi:hypothetical protein